MIQGGLLKIWPELVCRKRADAQSRRCRCPTGPRRKRFSKALPFLFGWQHGKIELKFGMLDCQRRRDRRIVTGCCEVLLHPVSFGKKVVVGTPTLTNGLAFANEFPPRGKIGAHPKEG